MEDEITVTPSFDQDPLIIRAFAEAWRFKKACWINPIFNLENTLIDPLPHQLEAVYDYLLPQNRLRFLLADDAGAGKTIMAGLYLVEMMQKQKINRVLIVCPAGLVDNWKSELFKLFQLNFTILSGDECRKQMIIDNNASILSIDTAWRIEEPILNSVPWDLVIFDEAHKLSVDLDRFGIPNPTHRFDIAEKLSRKCQHLLLLTATPHQGKEYPYFGLWRILEPAVFPNPEAMRKYFEKNPGDYKKYILRRLKEEMIDREGRALFPDRECRTIAYNFSTLEKKLYEAVTQYVTEVYARAEMKNKSSVNFAMLILQRRMASSTSALYQSLEKRKTKLLQLREKITNPKASPVPSEKTQDTITDVLFEKTGDEEIATSTSEENEQSEEEVIGATVDSQLEDISNDLVRLDYLIELCRDVLNQRTESKWSQLKKTIEEVRDPYGMEKPDEIKILVFTEYRDTKRFLIDRLNEMGYTGRVAEIDGTMDPFERKKQIKLFRSQAYRFLIATDAAGEGINLQFAWMLINYDIPWNPARLEQRMGRVHRYKQKHDPVILLNVLTRDSREGRVLEVLLEKLKRIKEAYKEAFQNAKGGDKVFDIIGQQFFDIPLHKIIIDAVMSKDGGDRAVQTINSLFDPTKVIGQLKEDRIRERGKTNPTELLTRMKYFQAEAAKYRLMPEYVKIFFNLIVKYLGYETHLEGENLFSLKPFDAFIAKSVENYPPEIQNIFSFYPKNALPDNFQDPKAVFLHPGEDLFEKLSLLFINRLEENARKGAIYLEVGGKQPCLFYFFTSDIILKSFTLENQPIKKVKSYLFAFKQFLSGEFEETAVYLLMDLVPVFAPASNQAKRHPKERIPKELVEKANHVDPIKEFIVGKYLLPELTRLKSEYQTSMVQKRNAIRSAYTQEEVSLVQMKKRLRDSISADEPFARSKFKQVALQLDSLKQKLISDLELFTENPQYMEFTAPQLVLTSIILPSVESDEEQEKAKFDSVDSEIKAMNIVEEYEIKDNHAVKIEKVENPWTGAGYDMISERVNERRFIEVKGRLGFASIDLTDNEYGRAAIERENYYLYVVFNCAEEPELWIYQDPFGRLKHQQKTLITINASSIKEGGFRAK